LAQIRIEPPNGLCWGVELIRMHFTKEISGLSTGTVLLPQSQERVARQFRSTMNTRGVRDGPEFPGAGPFQDPTRTRAVDGRKGFLHFSGGEMRTPIRIPAGGRR